MVAPTAPAVAASADVGQDDPSPSAPAPSARRDVAPLARAMRPPAAAAYCDGSVGAGRPARGRVGAGGSGAWLGARSRVAVAAAVTAVPTLVSGEGDAGAERGDAASAGSSSEDSAGGHGGGGGLGEAGASSAPATCVALAAFAARTTPRLGCSRPHFMDGATPTIASDACPLARARDPHSGVAAAARPARAAPEKSDSSRRVGVTAATGGAGRADAEMAATFLPWRASVLLTAARGAEVKKKQCERAVLRALVRTRTSQPARSHNEDGKFLREAIQSVPLFHTHPYASSKEARLTTRATYGIEA